MGLGKLKIHGHTVLFEGAARAGVQHLLRDLDYKEAEIFFRNARAQGKAEFEDDQDRDFTLIRNTDGSYTLERR